MAKKKTTNHTGESIAIGAAVAAVAGLVFLYGTEAGKKKRKKVRGWMLKAKGEVLENLEKAKEVNETLYNETVEKVMTKYAKLKHVQEDEIEPLIKEFKTHWKQVKKELTPKKKKTAKKTTKKKTTKKPVAKKKTTKKKK